MRDEGPPDGEDSGRECKMSGMAVVFFSCSIFVLSVEAEHTEDVLFDQ